MSHTHELSELEKLRHSAAHLLAAAVTALRPDAKPTIGPAIEEGFYYDIAFDEPFTQDDLKAVEKKMYQLVQSWKSFERMEVSQEEALKQFANNPFKQELIREFSSEGQSLTLYKSGEFIDLCRGGHTEAPSKELRHFTLLSVAGAYWRGDEKREMLTRIYGTAFFSKEELEAFIKMKEEAKKRDHRKLGKELELFMVSPKVGSGFPLYMPKGATVRRVILDWLLAEKEKRGYQFVWTPHVGKSDLYIQSGHWQKYDAMFKPMLLDDDEYVMKPMNCPHHFQIFNARPRSYREFPLYLAENATVYRNEQSGELNGLLRVRSLTQDDTHAFVRHAQIAQEIDRVLDLTFFVYEKFGFTDFKARISVRDPQHPEKYMGDPANWDKAEAALIKAVEDRNVEYFVGEGEAAFYGPKIDVMVRDALGREWQLTTCQLDFVQPENFDMSYINESGENERPAVLHIAILGSIDRFMGILIEQYAGAFPYWLAPVQAVVVPISDRHLEFGNTVLEQLQAAGIRVEIDKSSETLGKKIRNAQKAKVPYMLVIGDEEVSANSVMVRSREGGEQRAVGVAELVQELG